MSKRMDIKKVLIIGSGPIIRPASLTIPAPRPARRCGSLDTRLCW